MEEWVPEDKRDTAWYLFNKLFLCRVNNLKTMSLDYMRHFGTPHTGHERYDAETANELVDRMLSINQIAEFHKQGVSVMVVNPKDTAKIYELISNHLNAWKEHLNRSLYIKEAPLEDLVMLDKLANTVYAHAKHNFDSVYVDSLLARRLFNNFAVAKTDLFTGPDFKKKEEEAEAIPERVSMASVFATKKPIAKGPTWK